jgi:hypothetical protein
VVDEARETGIEHFIFVTGRNKFATDGRHVPSRYHRGNFVRTSPTAAPRPPAARGRGRHRNGAPNRNYKWCAFCRRFA